MSRNVIVIGGVALGPKAASRLKRLDPTANVTMIDENINISFGGCGIPYYVSGEINSLDALRSYEVMLYLHNHGVTDVVNALGGMQALIKRGDNM